jgi:hypothetical protein
MLMLSLPQNQLLRNLLVTRDRDFGYSVPVNRLLGIALLLTAYCFADVPFEMQQTSGNLSIFARQLDQSVVLLVHTNEKSTTEFYVTIRVALPSGETAAYSKTVAKYPDDVPGAFWTGVSIPTVAHPEKLVSVTVEERTTPKTTDFH